MINNIVYILIGIGLFFSLLRILKGPSSFDRILSLDIMNVIITGLIVFIAYIFKSSLYLDIALVYSILSFLETILFARYLEGRA